MTRQGDPEEPIPGKLPWVGNSPWVDPGNLHHPKVTVPGGPGRTDTVACAGRWALYDTEEPTREHRALCGSCPFQDWCRETATANGEWWIWGATSHEDRRGRNAA